MMVKSMLSFCLFLVAFAEEAATDDSSIDVGLEQICIWLPIVLVLTVGSAVYALFNMDEGRDSLLNAKFLIAEPSHERH
ncbi:unnamed protein product [Blepharisma stoltei]|uniref:Uncharacterized protein n=1 Tax=Blepharisma stoltei TaxID=1481888 RepID=A0AAU9IB70_9CILI|nr:unnamed protein product [Blepharisma stoltei]